MNIIDRIEEGENIRTEFKECGNTLPKNLFETICAFLNRFGGDIFLGVADNGKIIGVDKGSISRLKKEISALCNNANKISPTVFLWTEECVLEGKSILHIYVPESSQVHSTSGRIYDRNEDGDFDITRNSYLVAQRYIHKQNNFTENIVYPYATIKDLDSQTIRDVRTMAFNRRADHPWKNLSNEQLLKSCGLYKKDLRTGESGYTLACILLFGKEESILSVLPYYKTDAIYRKLNFDRYDDRDEIKCNLIRSYDRLMAFIEKHLDDKFYLEGVQRIDIRNKLFREAVANMLIHREYSSAYPARFIIDLDRVVTENGNNPRNYGRIDLDHMTPYPKNPVIASIFKEIGWAEELGSGVRNMKKYSVIYSGCLPEMEDGDVFRTTIFLRGVRIDRGNKTEERDPNWESQGKGGINPESDGINPESDGISLSPKERCVFNAIRSNRSITRERLSVDTGYSLATIDRLIKALKDKGCLKGKTANRGGQWVL